MSLAHIKQLLLTRNKTNIELAKELAKSINLDMYDWFEQEGWAKYLDIIKPEDFIDLRELYIFDAPDLHILKDFAFVEVLYCSADSCSLKLDGIEHLTQLQFLQFDNTGVTDLSPLQHLKNLTFINCNQNPIQDLRPLQHLSKLEHLYCNYCQIQDLSPLKGLYRLRYLLCANNPITTIEPIFALNLVRLGFDNKMIPQEELSKFRAQFPNCHMLNIDLED